MSEIRERVAPWVEGAVLAAVVAAILVWGGDAVRASYHGYLHVGVGEAVLRDGLEPENAYHAGTPLRYYTLYPALGVWIGRCGLGPLWAFALLNVLSALLLAPALDAIGRALGLSYRARRAAFVAVVLGFNGLGWLGFLFSSGDPFGRPPVYVLKRLTFANEAFGWDARVQAFLPKFLNVSSYALALPFALWAMAESAGHLTAAAQRSDGGRRHAVRAILPAAFSLALNPLVGGWAGLCMALWLLPALVRGTWKERAAWALSALAALVLAAPFLLSVLVPSAKGPSLLGKPALGGSPIPNLIGPLLILLVPGVLGLLRMSFAARWRWAVAAGCAAALVLAGEMPQGNEYKMARLSALLWGIPAGVWAAAALERGGVQRAIVWLAALLCLPTTVAVPRAYLAWSKEATPLPLHVEHGRMAIDPTAVNHAIPQAILDAESRADPRAILLMHPFNPGSRTDSDLVQGNALGPALHHPLFADLPQIHNEYLPDLEERLRATFSLYGAPADNPFFRKGRLAPADAWREIRSLLPERPLLVLTHRSMHEVEELCAADEARVLARDGEYTMWLVAPLRPGQ